MPKKLECVFKVDFFSIRIEKELKSEVDLSPNLDQSHDNISNEEWNNMARQESILASDFK